jgi:hypothetical protein
VELDLLLDVGAVRAEQRAEALQLHGRYQRVLRRNKEEQ